MIFLIKVNALNSSKNVNEMNASWNISMHFFSILMKNFIIISNWMFTRIIFLTDFKNLLIALLISYNFELHFIFIYDWILTNVNCALFQKTIETIDKAAFPPSNMVHKECNWI